MASDAENGEYVVEKIIKHRRVKQSGTMVTEYLVRWDGYTEADDTWEPFNNLTELTVQAYKKSLAKGGTAPNSRNSGVARQSGPRKTPVRSGPGKRGRPGKRGSGRPRKEEQDQESNATGVSDEMDDMKENGTKSKQPKRLSRPRTFDDPDSNLEEHSYSAKDENELNDSVTDQQNGNISTYEDAITDIVVNADLISSNDTEMTDDENSAGEAVKEIPEEFVNLVNEWTKDAKELDKRVKQFEQLLEDLKEDRDKILHKKDYALHLLKVYKKNVPK
ncbi:hypothetical protein HDE_11642 [Halotydeus destructor]|nr:hypothetical protein HDE_11642 [Halotydeus destructor]